MKNKPKQSANNKKWIMGDSNSRLVAGTLVGFILVLMSSVFYGMQNVYATASSLSISVTDGANPSVNVAPTANGRFIASEKTEFTVNTTHAAGYTVTVKSTALKDSTNTISTLTLPSGTSGITEVNYKDSTYASENNLNNTWGYLPSNLCTTGEATTTCAANTLYLPAPISATQTLDEVSSATDNTYNISIGTRVNTDTAQGAYTTTFTVAAVGNATPYSITYNKNTTDAVANMPANHTTSDEGVSGETVTLATNEPSREGYEFKGWCTAVVADGAACTGTSYAAGGTWTLNQTAATNSLTLYAVWKSSDPCEGVNSLYCSVATMSKGAQTADDLKSTITIPTSADYAEDTSNSGVYEYDASVFGVASDAGNDYAIYYYRGVLENEVGSYGSDGSAVTYPNYVILSAAPDKSGFTTDDTCWRIVRTTGSGGVKMIYNGKWTGSTCANSGNSTLAAFKAYGTAPQGYIVDVGYTYNNSVRTSTSSTSVDIVFGSNSNHFVNSTNSPMKTYIEGTWFTNINGWASKLEPSAGYCNDRVVYSASTGGMALTTIIPYKTSTSQAMGYFNAYVRAYNASDKPTLTCARNVVDLYTTSSASNGNKQLSKPAALLTADEANFAGSGAYSNGSGVYHANSYLCSGTVFWLLSPEARYSNGPVYGFLLRSSGTFYSAGVSSSFGVRPAISLIPGTSATGGSGTATDPWVVNP